jgi:tetratricopeptide (TPR) repeat protein
MNQLRPRISTITAPAMRRISQAATLACLRVIAGQQDAQWGYDAGWKFLKQGNLFGAETYARVAVMLDPSWDWGYDLLAFVYGQMGKARKAKEIVERGLRRCPESARLLIRLGLIEQESGALDTALVRYRRAVEIAPGNAAALQHLGGALRSTKSYEEAIQVLRQAHTAKPDDVWTLSTLCEVYAKMGDYSAAIPFCQEAVERDPSEKVAWFYLGVAHAYSGRQTDAEEPLRRAVELDPTNEEFQNLLRTTGILAELRRAGTGTSTKITQLALVRGNPEQRGQTLRIEFTGLGPFAAGPISHAIADEAEARRQYPSWNWREPTADERAAMSDRGELLLVAHAPPDGHC